MLSEAAAPVKRETGTERDPYEDLVRTEGHDSDRMQSRRAHFRAAGTRIRAARPAAPNRHGSARDDRRLGFSVRSGHARVVRAGRIHRARTALLPVFRLPP